MELISVIVPIYKVEPYLDKCIRSITEQTYSNLEIILVDDGSPDGCPAICDAWAKKDSRIKVIHKENGGLSDARNAGLKVATGAYVAFVDSDDWISAEYINYMVQAIQKSGAEIAACDVAISFDETISPKISQNFEVKICTAEQALNDILQGKGFRAVAWNKLYAKNLLENESYPIGKYHEDEFFTYRILAKAKTLVYIDCALYTYFQRDNSIMNSKSAKHLDALDAYIERLIFLQKHYPILYQKDKITFCFSCVSFYRQYLKFGIEMRKCRKKIRTLRRNVRFSISELKLCTKKQLATVFCSRYFINFFSFALNLKNKSN